ncbi:MAG TPA: TetR/AcrR family transcriptional regulator [Candidatus Acidoferrum sp.]|nr:TetR/AcrR family transcriptional regulator [Candidatus Acidoferrum sp.]
MASSTPTFRDSEAKLQHILRIAAQVFAQRGFEGASMRDISRAAGVSLAGLYYYFENKQHLLYLIQSTTFTVVLENLRSRLQGVHEPAERLRLLVLNHIEYFLSHPNEMKVLSHEEEALGDPYSEKVQAIKRRYYALAREIFDSIAAEGLAPGVHSRVAVLSLFGMMNWTYKWHKPGVDPDASELTAAIVGLFLHGIQAAGLELKPAFAAGVAGAEPR